MNIWQDSNNQFKVKLCNAHTLEFDKWKVQHDKSNSDIVTITVTKEVLNKIFGMVEELMNEPKPTYRVEYIDLKVEKANVQKIESINERDIKGNDKPSS